MSATRQPNLRSVVLSSIGRKFLLGLTGLALCGFLVMHLAGNLLILVSQSAFNAYGNGLRNLPIAVPGELALAGLFVAHLVLAIWVTRENKTARPVGYAVHARKGGRTIASKTMIITGMLTALFLVLHMIQFRFGMEELKTQPGAPLKFGFSATVLHVWRDSSMAVVNVATYLAAFALLGIHVRHGLQSALRSVGVGHPDWQPVVDKVSIGYGVAIWVGYSIIPVWVLLRGMAP
ncbi:MAG: succinate dehydrogenase cytochrome b subunit [Planctomycetota bacterium]